MSFKLRIPGRDEIQTAPAANPANPLIEVKALKSEILQRPTSVTSAPTGEPISRLAGLAAPEVCEIDDETMRERSAIISANGTPYWQADNLAGLLPWTGAYSDQTRHLFRSKPTSHSSSNRPQTPIRDHLLGLTYWLKPGQSCPRRWSVGACDEPTDQRGGQLVFKAQDVLVGFPARSLFGRCDLRITSV